MQTYTEVDGRWFPGTLLQEMRVHSSGFLGFFSYLSADFDDGWFRVEKWDFEGPFTSECALREELVATIKRGRDASRRVH